MSNEFTTVISGETYLKALSDKPIEPDDISVKTEEANSKELNMIPLSILWAYFQAYEENLITEGEPTPWEDSQENSHLSDQEKKAWIQFLDTILTEDWATWVQDIDEIKKRSITAYNQLQYVDKTNQHKSKQTISLKEALSIQFELNIDTKIDNFTTTKEESNIESEG
ncbi:hypothetical protein Halha_1268 [Halobacteroides halobius DSM 5150]|uniref:Uncharacterized protein n=1 Tax=Halobacteroides halobius (strain ATCC 35273 / DSM 5150 / MD-1) TaxID=748449 RepID=L0KA12_HALHC|nr:hypothetical protein [Halobacteroides halobius]AGB41214.1 hypothetical protein Halha_1268 [Halobacteroides halobius DSM 5150]